MKKKNKNYGGKREGAGRKCVFNEPSIQMTFRVPVSKRDEIKEQVKTILSRYRHENTTTQISRSVI